MTNRIAPRAGHARPGPQSQYETSGSSLDLPNFIGGSPKYSRIAAPLTSMLKTSSTKSAKPRKGVVGVGGGGRNRAEPVGKHELDGSDDGGHVDGGSRNGDSDRNSSDAPKLMCPPAPCTSRLRTSASTDSSINATKIVVDFDRVDDCDGRSGDFDVTFQIIRWRSGYCSFARKSQ